MKIDVAFLIAPGRGQNTDGRFYIMVAGAKTSFTIHGPNNPGASGTVTQVKDERAAKKKLHEKERRGYSHTDPSNIAAGARKTMIAEIAKAYPEIAGQSYQIQNGEIVFSDSTGPEKSRRPRSVASPIKDMWF